MFYNFDWVYTDLAVIRALIHDGKRMVTSLKTLISFFNNNRLSVDVLGSGQLTLNDMDSVIEALRSTPDHMLISDVVDRYVLESCKNKDAKILRNSNSILFSLIHHFISLTV